MHYTLPHLTCSDKKRNKRLDDDYDMDANPTKQVPKHRVETPAMQLSMMPACSSLAVLVPLEQLLVSKGRPHDNRDVG